MSDILTNLQEALAAITAINGADNSVREGIQRAIEFCKTGNLNLPAPAPPQTPVTVKFKHEPFLGPKNFPPGVQIPQQTQFRSNPKS
jgi:hypothetical protein